MVEPFSQHGLLKLAVRQSQAFNSVGVADRAAATIIKYSVVAMALVAPIVYVDLGKFIHVLISLPSVTKCNRDLTARIAYALCRHCWFNILQPSVGWWVFSNFLFVPRFILI